MSTPTNDGGPAFPRAGFLSEIETPEQVIAQYENKPEQGMSLLDYFAGQALVGMMNHRDLVNRPCLELAWDSYEYDEAMLAVRKEANP